MKLKGMVLTADNPLVQRLPSWGEFWDIKGNLPKDSSSHSSRTPVDQILGIFGTKKKQ